MRPGRRPGSRRSALSQEAEIAKLEGEIEAATVEADVALKAQCVAEHGARQLLVLHGEGLLPEDRVPDELRSLIARGEAEQRVPQADHARTVAVEERNRRRAKVTTSKPALRTSP